MHLLYIYAYNTLIFSFFCFFSHQYSKPLIDRLNSELSGSFRNLVIALLMGERQEDVVDEDLAVEQAQELHDAGIGKRLGTDKATFIRIITQASRPQIEVCKLYWVLVVLGEKRNTYAGSTRTHRDTLTGRERAAGLMYNNSTVPVPMQLTSKFDLHLSPRLDHQARIGACVCVCVFLVLQTSLRVDSASMFLRSVHFTVTTLSVAPSMF